MDSANQPESVDTNLFEDEILVTSTMDENSEESKFDEMIGALQDILMDDRFIEMQKAFCDQHCEIFEDATENKLSYTPLFEQYQTLIESFIEHQMMQKLEHFSMEELGRQMEEHEDEIPQDVIDVLMGCSDFDEFKGLMLSHKQNEAPQFEITGDAIAVGPQ